MTLRVEDLDQLPPPLRRRVEAALRKEGGRKGQDRGGHSPTPRTADVKKIVSQLPEGPAPGARDRSRGRGVAEARWQADVVAIARALGWWAYHTYDSRRSAPGFPDLVLVRERVVFAELKRAGGRLTPDQRHVIAILKAAGAEVYVWWPADVDDVHQVLASR